MSDRRFDVSVQTVIYRCDGSLFTDLGTMRWPGVNKAVVDWLSGSCKATAFWLIGLPEAVGEESYTLKYRTIVTSGGKAVSDTTLLEFPHLTYADTVRFEHWALVQLAELVALFEQQHGRRRELTRHRSKVRTVLRVLWGKLRYAVGGAA